ncbi:MAG: ribosome recycling factor [Myxococcales bacterium]|nr:ribosome recycling factor [Myxococcales bacterium]
MEEIDLILEVLEDNFSKVLGVLNKSLSRTRTGRANLTMLDGIRVDYYGSPSPLNQVASLTVADPRLITIKPWEKNQISAIEKAIIQSDIGITPNNDGNIIRLPIPALSGERRKDLVKQIKKLGEEAKIAIRNHRRDANEQVKGVDNLPEDLMHKTLDRVQQETDKHIKLVDDSVAKKEKEILEV